MFNKPHGFAKIFADLTNTRARGDLIAAGELIEVPQDALEQAGTARPIAITRDVWEDCVVWTDADQKAVQEIAFVDQGIRLYDVVRTTMQAILAATSLHSVTYTLTRMPRPHGQKLLAMPDENDRLVTLKAVAVVGDSRRPALTIMRAQED